MRKLNRNQKKTKTISTKRESKLRRLPRRLEDKEFQLRFMATGIKRTNLFPLLYLNQKRLNIRLRRDCNIVFSFNILSQKTWKLLSRQCRNANSSLESML